MLGPASPPESFFPPARKGSRTPRGTAAPCSESSNRASLYSHAPRAQFHPCAPRPVRVLRRFVPPRPEFAAPFPGSRFFCVLLHNSLLSDSLATLARRRIVLQTRRPAA